MQSRLASQWATFPASLVAWQHSPLLVPQEPSLAQLPLAQAPRQPSKQAKRQLVEARV
jgi:hypothetical protein